MHHVTNRLLCRQETLYCWVIGFDPVGCVVTKVTSCINDVSHPCRLHRVPVFDEVVIELGWCQIFQCQQTHVILLVRFCIQHCLPFLSNFLFHVTWYLHGSRFLPESLRYMKSTEDDVYFGQCFVDHTKEGEVLIHNKAFQFLLNGRRITYQTFNKEPDIILCFCLHNTLCNDLAWSVSVFNQCTNQWHSPVVQVVSGVNSHYLTVPFNQNFHWWRLYEDCFEVVVITCLHMDCWCWIIIKNGLQFTQQLFLLIRSYLFMQGSNVVDILPGQHLSWLFRQVSSQMFNFHTHCKHVGSFCFDIWR